MGLLCHAGAGMVKRRLEDGQGSDNADIQECASENVRGGLMTHTTTQMKMQIDYYY